MGDETGLEVFLAEHDLHGLSPAQQASAHCALEEAVRREQRRGHLVRYLQRIAVPAEHRCLCLFQAPGLGAVRAVNDIAQFPLARIVVVTCSVPAGPAPHARPRGGPP